MSDDKPAPRWEVAAESEDLKAFLEEELAGELGPAVEAATYAEVAARWVNGPAGMERQGPPPARLEAVISLIAEAEQRHGSMYCKVTTYELRQALGMDVTNWPNP